MNFEKPSSTQMMLDLLKIERCWPHATPIDTNQMVQKRAKLAAIGNLK
jgi:hypothetical protein